MGDGNETCSRDCLLGCHVISNIQAVNGIIVVNESVYMMFKSIYLRIAVQLMCVSPYIVPLRLFIGIDT